MQMNPYLHYNGNCEAAFDYYAKVLGGRIGMKMTYAQAPADMPKSPGFDGKIMHASLIIDGEVLMGSDAPPERFNKPQGFSVSLQVEDAADGKKKFDALAEGGTVHMAYGPTFWAKGFGMCVDRFGTPWMVNCPAEGMS
ncbi:VOC family protein [soil metagenome]